MNGPLRDLHDRGVGARIGLWGAVVSIVALAAVGGIGIALSQPWLFPSLGPTVMVLSETPRQPAASPVNTLVGHLVGVVAGYLALAVVGLRSAPPVIVTGLDTDRVVAACLSLAVTVLVLQLLRTPHPPAGATTLIVSLGILARPAQMLALLLSVLVLVTVGTALNAVMGVRQAGVTGPATG